MKFVGVFLLLSLCAHSSLGQPNPSSTVVYLSQEENQFYLLINKFRAELGLPTLQIHVLLQNAAKKHSEWMAGQDFLTHLGPSRLRTPVQRMTEEGYENYTFMGENVACGNNDPVKTFRQWAFSPGHLANMINPHYRHMGIAKAGTGNERCPYYWTNDFGSLSDLSQDPDPITDVEKVRTAVVNVSGSIPASQTFKLPSQKPGQRNDNNGEEVETPAPPKSDFSLIQCTIPYAIAKNVLSFSPNTDAVLDITPNSTGSYSGLVNYLQNGASTSFYPFTINNISVVKNPSYPLYVIFATAVNRNIGFLIQFDAAKSSAQFSPYPASAGIDGSVLCTFKY